MKITHLKNKTYSIHPNYIDLAIYFIDNKNLILIDTGYRATALDELIPFFIEKDYYVKGILCTHSHLDHTGGNPPLVEKYHSKVYAPYVESIFSESTYNMYIVRNNFRFTATKEQLPQFAYKIDHIIPSEATSIELFDQSFQVIPLPGHSPYQVGYISPDNIAYLADSIISEPLLLKTKIPYVFDVDRDLKTKKSLKNLNCDGYLLSHYGYYENIDALIDLNIHHLETKTEQLLDLLKAPHTFDTYTSHVMKQLQIKPSVAKIVYLQEMLRSFLTYYFQHDLVDVCESKGLLYIQKK